jgi:hypothetical protein
MNLNIHLSLFYLSFNLVFRYSNLSSSSSFILQIIAVCCSLFVCSTVLPRLFYCSLLWEGVTTPAVNALPDRVVVFFVSLLESASKRR